MYLKKMFRVFEINFEYVVCQFVFISELAKYQNLVDKLAVFIHKVLSVHKRTHYKK